LLDGELVSVEVFVHRTTAWSASERVVPLNRLASLSDDHFGVAVLQ
jgi:hypothetical protein